MIKNNDINKSQANIKDYSKVNISLYKETNLI